MNSAEKRLLGAFITLFVLGVVAGNLPKLFAAPLTLVEENLLQVPPQQMVALTEATPDSSNSRVKKNTSAKAKKVASKEHPVRINHADSLEILTLPGVGPAMAHLLLDYKRQHGSFKKPADLLKIKGIGKKKQEKLLPLLIFD